MGLTRWLVAGLLLAGLAQGVEGGWILLKASLAQVLLDRAWADTLATGAPVRPWPWADTWPVALLNVPSQGLQRWVLAGDSGNALAFGPGHATASAELGSSGLAVIGGHRDTHFAFLRNLAPGAELQLQLPNGHWRTYRAASAEVVDASEESLPVSTGVERLLLVTCYPFDALQANGPLRYVVQALPVAQPPGAVYAM